MKLFDSRSSCLRMYNSQENRGNKRDCRQKYPETRKVIRNLNSITQTVSHFLRITLTVISQYEIYRKEGEQKRVEKVEITS